MESNIIKSAGIKDFFWDDSVGPVENLFGLMEYGYMFLGGFLGKAAIMLASLFGISLRHLGRKIDEMFELTSLEDLANINLSVFASTDAYWIKNASIYKKLNALDNETLKVVLGTPSLLNEKFRRDLRHSDYDRPGGVFNPKGPARSSNVFLGGKLKEILGFLKQFAGRLLTSGLGSFLTLTGIQAMTEKDPESQTNKEVKIEGKSGLEAAVTEALRR
jgi:hypothetical protein